MVDATETFAAIKARAEASRVKKNHDGANCSKRGTAACLLKCGTSNEVTQATSGETKPVIANIMQAIVLVNNSKPMVA